jgi:hypothetical protein
MTQISGRLRNPCSVCRVSVNIPQSRTWTFHFWDVYKVLPSPAWECPSFTLDYPSGNSLDTTSKHYLRPKYTGYVISWRQSGEMPIEMHGSSIVKLNVWGGNDETAADVLDDISQILERMAIRSRVHNYPNVYHYDGTNDDQNDRNQGAGWLVACVISDNTTKTPE